MSATSLPSLDSAYPVPGNAVGSYQRDGFVLLRKIATPQEIAPYREAIVETTFGQASDRKPLAERDTYGKAFIQVMNLWRTNERVARFVLAPRFARIAATLLGVDRVRLYHDQALFKEPGGGHTPWHQDGFFWPLDASRTVTMWMPLVDITAEMGSMTFAGGSQRDGFIKVPDGISDESDEFYNEYVVSKGYPLITSGAMAAGDATFHSGITIHRAPENATQTTREVMTVIYFADGELVQEPQNANQDVDRQAWLDGAAPGTPAASALNPLLG